MSRLALTAVRRLPRPVGVALLGLLVLLGWLVPGRLGSADVAIRELALPGVRVVVGETAAERMPHQASMPAGMMSHELPAGWHRVSVPVTLLGEDGDAAGYAGSSFRLVGGGLAGPVAPDREDLGSGRLPAGVRVTGHLVFAVPGDAGAVELTTVGGDDGLKILLPAPAHPGPAPAAGPAHHVTG